MLKARIPIVLLGAFCITTVFGQEWIDNYQKGLDAAKKSDWALARSWFQRAAADRAVDQAGPTSLPGPASEPRVWRAGAPYSPNFAAAYSGYRLALETFDTTERNRMLMSVAEETEKILSAGQHSPEAYAMATQCYVLLRADDKLKALEAKRAAQKTLSWKVDNEFITPEDAQLAANLKPVEPVTPPVKPQTDTPPQGGTKPVKDDGKKPADTTKPVKDDGKKPALPAANAPVEYLPNKYALVIGNSDSRLPLMSQPFASNDADSIKTALSTHAGYDPANITVVSNATSTQIAEAANALAARVSDGSTVVLFFSGVGTSISGKDYLAGIDTSDFFDTTTMMSKMDLLRTFTSKGARVFSFYQVNRNTSETKSFGSEVPTVGAVSQMMGTIEGTKLYSVMENGREAGLFAVGLRKAFENFHTNSVPILEFGWQVFYAMRGGSSSSATGGGGIQTPSLPALVFLDPEARF